MKQYCRYCSNAFDYNGEETDFLCTANAPCGGNGSGLFYDAKKAKRVNKCPHFIFCSNDIFRLGENGEYKQYKPRGKRDYEQLKMEIEVKA